MLDLVLSLANVVLVGLVRFLLQYIKCQFWASGGMPKYIPGEFTVLFDLLFAMDWHDAVTPPCELLLPPPCRGSPVSSKDANSDQFRLSSRVPAVKEVYMSPWGNIVPYYLPPHPPGSPSLHGSIQLLVRRSTFCKKGCTHPAQPSCESNFMGFPSIWKDSQPKTVLL
ncbi:hypothetical protein B0H13DRAFT_1929250 [Mycena leptocephala]|nr:hypothetical protein B0H13DRAFT_1929250 [Mycena leptocephala]